MVKISIPPFQAPTQGTRGDQPQMAANLGAALQMLVTASQANTQLLGQIYQAITALAANTTANNTFIGNNTFTGLNSFTNSNTFSGTNTFSNANAFTGQNTFSNANTFSGSNTFAGLIYATRVVTAAGTVTVANTDYVVVVNKTVGAATTVNLPATPATGRTFIIKDGKGDAGANNITITPAAGTIDGAGTSVISTNFGFSMLTYNGTQWNLT